MAQTALIPAVAIQSSASLDSPRHSAVVRITHWITALSFFGLLYSGIAILIAHPRLYWGDTGGVGAPSLIDLPIPFMIGHSGWGRYLHFLSAWTAVLTGMVYAFSGAVSKHFRRDLLPTREEMSWGRVWRIVWNDLRWKRPAEEDSLTYNVVQKLTYLGVVFVLFPLIILSGLAMSPAIASVVPTLRIGFGGQQSARTIHFFVTLALVLFLCVHIAMVCLAGFTGRVRAMITGYSAARKVRT
ncbi:MAG TPA: cytochrome b/b6 domain-containing protein [Candidatus Acidoferrum sp.]|jgi:thiosulfate reductase cytochrome b subunit|nr:cytochrome b/b6 domain-containing protein [Candidatus Acidoferrum sp.]